MRTRPVLGVEGETSRAQSSYGRDDSVHDDQGAGAGLLHSAGRLSTNRGPLSTRQVRINGAKGSEYEPGYGTNEGIRRPSIRPSPTSVGVDEFSDRGKFSPQLIVDAYLAIDLVAGVQHGGVVSSAQFGANAKQRDIRLLAH